MNKQVIKERIEEYLTGNYDIEAVDIRFGSMAGKILVQILVDKTGGITLDDLSEINRNLSREMDAWDTGPDAFVLEVSSAGVERPLTKLEHFARFRDRKAKIELHAPLEGNRRRYVGAIRDVQGDVIVLHCDAGDIKIPFSRIKKANLVFEFS